MEKKIDISEKLKSSGISPSVQRMEIYRYLIEMRNHPTVETIYHALHKTIPTLSKTTVYNTLKLFVTKGIAIEITIDKNELRYDADIDIHGHFLNEDSGKIQDIDIDVSGLNPEFFEKAEIKEHHIYFKGSYNDDKPKQ